jgi:tRNA A37 threonylcarbamoyladenosine synthetase subunit TsaC/SUA5/YrdC
VGIIPTDTLPALVCDPESRSAVMRMYDIKEVSPKKQLSLLCRWARCPPPGAAAILPAACPRST